MLQAGACPLLSVRGRLLLSNWGLPALRQHLAADAVLPLSDQAASAPPVAPNFSTFSLLSSKLTVRLHVDQSTLVTAHHRLARRELRRKSMKSFNAGRI